MRVRAANQLMAASFIAIIAAAGTNGAKATTPESLSSNLVAQQQPRQRRLAPSGPCAKRNASDLYCLDLHAVPEVEGANGSVDLGRVTSPFGVAVTPAGHHVHQLTAHIEGLPDPTSLGPYSAYVAWATTPFFEPVIKLGEVDNGVNSLGRIEFNKFLVLITAETSADVENRNGRLILRGRSPSLFMDPHDLMTQAPSAVMGPMNRGSGTREQPIEQERTSQGTLKTDETPWGWSMPPTHPLVPMLPGMMGLAPQVEKLSPAALTDKQLGNLPEAQPSQAVRLPDGGTLDLEASLVRRSLGDGCETLMMAFNGQLPGPMIRVDEKSTVFINFTNKTLIPTAVHWHGVRLDNRFDGVPGLTQDPVEQNGTFRYQIYLPDAGIYWYHPHPREDIMQELGLYGNLLVDPRPAGYYSPVNKEEILILDDFLINSEGENVWFGQESANYMLMGRFGNEFLVNGEPLYELDVARGEVVRFYFTNASNTRTFNISFQQEEGPLRDSRAEYTANGAMQRVPDAPLAMKVVGSDVGKFEREQLVQSMVIAPAERYVVEVRFDKPGKFHVNNQVQAINHRFGTFFPEIDTLGVVRVAERITSANHGPAFDVLRQNADVIGDIDDYRDHFDNPIDLELALTLGVANLPLPIEQVMLYDWIYFNPVEWSGTMPIMNWLTTSNEVTWLLRDSVTGAENMDIDWNFQVGDVVKIRLVNNRAAWHAMQHPLHIHGQRFLVLDQDGVRNNNLVWKDTVLLPTGTTTDILLEISNPGRWMVHCHIAEHLESGMKFVFEVLPNAPQGGMN